MTTASTTRAIAARKPRPIWSFARRLGVQAAMSVTVMAGLQLASVNGYDIGDLLPGHAPDAAPIQPSAEPVRVVGVPARFDIPVEAGGTPDRIQPLEVDAAPRKNAPPVAKPVATDAAPKLERAALPASERVAVPTPRPRLVAATRPVAVPPRPSEMPFDVTPRDDGSSRGIEVYGVAELGPAEAPPMPIDVADAGFHVGRLVPSGTAILTRTAEITGSAAHVVTGTATRLLDLVR